MEFQTIPVFRIFDEQKAGDFYLGFLGMRLDWEHRFEADAPLYMQVSRENFLLHLSEHSADCTPGGKVLVMVDALDALFNEISSHDYRYNKPQIYQAPWGGRVFEVVDPFCNKLLFNEKT